MGNTVAFFLVGLQLSVCLTLVCQSPYKEILKTCLHVSKKKLLWCEAQDYCSSIDGELIRGSTYKLFDGKKKFAKLPRTYWIGLTDFLQERGTEKGGWRWTDGSLDPLSSELKWTRPEPSFSYEDCVRHCSDDGQICGMRCASFPVKTVCQPRLVLDRGDRGRKFKMASISVGLSGSDFAEEGCLKTVENVESKIRCAFLCSSEPKDWCVSFYFSQARKQCYLVLYTDATVKVQNSEDWAKFVKN